MKRWFVFCLVLLLLAPAASATDTKYEFQSSDWARKDVEKAIALGLDFDSYGGDYRKPIKRGEFAEKATSLVVLEFGSNLDSYLRITDYREQLRGSEQLPDRYNSVLGLANQFGILRGRGGNDWDTASYITRQEAAVMLARTYRAYQDKVPDNLTPLFFTDQDAIADWAMEDVRLMHNLGIMGEVGNNRFDPMGSYTIEQCLITLLRLHEKAPAAGPKQPNPFSLTPREKVIADHWSGFNNSVYYLQFTFETEQYYILSWGSRSGGVMGGLDYYISIIEPNLSFRQYEVPIIENSNYYQGTSHRAPENPSISEDGTKLIYTATVKKDVYYADENGKRGKAPVQQKGIYTVTMDLKTGKQIYTRTDLK